MQTLNCRAILFDLDGVLVDSTACVERHWQMWAERHGLRAELILANSHGRRTIDTMRLVAAHLDLNLEQEALWLEEIETRDLAGIVATPGALELVQALPTESWAIVTSATRGMAIARLQAVGLPVPRAFISAEEVSQGKPHPEGYLKAATWLHAAKSDCIVIEDAPAGIQAAHAAGIRAIGVTTTFPGGQLQEADFIINGLHHLSLMITKDTAIALPGLTLELDSYAK